MEHTCERIVQSIARYANAFVYITVLANEPKRGGQMSVTQCVQSFFDCNSSLTMLLTRYTAGERQSDGKNIFAAMPGAVDRFAKEVKNFAKACVGMLSPNVERCPRY